MQLIGISNRESGWLAANFLPNSLEMEGTQPPVVASNADNFKCEKSLDCFTNPVPVDSTCRIKIFKNKPSLFYLFTSPFIGAHTLNERDGKWIQLIGLVSFVHNGQWNSESKPFQVTNLKN